MSRYMINTEILKCISLRLRGVMFNIPLCSRLMNKPEKRTFAVNLMIKFRFALSQELY